MSIRLLTVAGGISSCLAVFLFLAWLVTGATYLPVLLATAAVAAIAIWLYVLPVARIRDSADLTAEARFSARNETRATLVQALGGAALLGSLFFTAQNVNATNQSLELTRQGEAAERFSTAIEQLGSDKLEVRIGATYALEQVSKEGVISPEVVHATLTSFLQEHNHLKVPRTDEGNPANRNIYGNTLLREDFQAILTVLGRSDIDRKGSNSVLDLFALDLGGAHLQEANLFRSNLEGSRLVGASMCGAILDESNLSGANFNSADLRGASFRGALMTGTDMSAANLGGADFTDAIIDNIDLRSAVLDDVVGLSDTQIAAAQRERDEFSMVSGTKQFCLFQSTN